MPRYVALLRGVSPMTCSMPQLRASLEAAGFEDVRTLLSSGNVAFTARDARTDLAALEQEIEAAIASSLGRTFLTIVRSSEHLAALVASTPFAEFSIPPSAKCIVTFLRRAEDRRIELPIERGGVRVLKQAGREVFTVYERNPKGPDFMVLLDRTFGKEITTRTLATVEKCARA